MYWYLRCPGTLLFLLRKTNESGSFLGRGGEAHVSIAVDALRIIHVPFSFFKWWGWSSDGGSDIYRAGEPITAQHRIAAPFAMAAV